MGISIICPVFNKEKYIIDTIKSVEAQSSKDWELILIDDGSTDLTIEKVTNYISQTNSDIKYYHRKNFSEIKGANACRNIGAQLAKYPLLLFFDADDIMMPACIENRLKYIENNLEYNFFVFGVAYSLGSPPIAYDKLEISKRTSLAIESKKDLKIEFLKQFLSFIFPWHTSGPVWKKTFFNEIGGFNIYLERLQDPEIHIKALLHKSIEMKFLIHEYGFDILHRKDEDRQIFDEITFFKKQINAVLEFIKIINSILKNSNHNELKYHLVNYLIFSETIYYKLIRDYEFKNSNILLNTLNSLYERDLNFIIPKKYLFFVKVILRPIERSKFLVMKKLPGFLLLKIKRMYS